MGSGPSGFYAAEALLRSGTPVEVTVIDRLPSPHGLVRAGVAPDHPKLKQATLVFERIGQLDGFRFFGNIEVGRTIGIDDIRQTPKWLRRCTAKFRRWRRPSLELKGKFRLLRMICSLQKGSELSRRIKILSLKFLHLFV